MKRLKYLIPLLILSVLVFAVHPFTALAAIAVDNNSNSGAFRQSATWSHTVNSSSNSILVVSVGSYYGIVGSPSSITATYNGVSMTKIRQDDDAGTTVSVAFFYMLNPPTGAHNIVATVAVDPGAVGLSMAGAVSLSGVDQTNPVDAQNTASDPTGSAVSSSVSVTTIAANAWVVDSLFLSSQTGTVTKGGSQTQEWNVSLPNVAGNSSGSVRGPIASPGSTAMTWTFPANIWDDTAVSFKPAATVAGPTHANVTVPKGTTTIQKGITTVN